MHAGRCVLFVSAAWMRLARQACLPHRLLARKPLRVRAACVLRRACCVRPPLARKPRGVRAACAGRLHGNHAACVLRACCVRAACCRWVHPPRGRRAPGINKGAGLCINLCKQLSFRHHGERVLKTHRARTLYHYLAAVRASHISVKCCVHINHFRAAIPVLVGRVESLCPATRPRHFSCMHIREPDIPSCIAHTPPKTTPAMQHFSGVRTGAPARLASHKSRLD